ncbi:suppressor of Mek1-like [Oppia nitens]|uniref:suppressor of Mek1-like n=1 Tax=Oppia nitens TaxID=1686743 RepID=UPI0023DC5E89|nr:suppressor of Mek1-like [Oppia nitens]
MSATEVDHTLATPTSPSLDDDNNQPIAAKRVSSPEPESNEEHEEVQQNGSKDTADDFIRYEERKLIDRLSQMMDKEFSTHTGAESRWKNGENESEQHVVVAETHEDKHAKPNDDHNENHTNGSVDDFLTQEEGNNQEQDSEKDDEHKPHRFAPSDDEYADQRHSVINEIQSILTSNPEIHENIRDNETTETTTHETHVKHEKHEDNHENHIPIVVHSEEKHELVDDNHEVDIETDITVGSAVIQEEINHYTEDPVENRNQRDNHFEIGTYGATNGDKNNNTKHLNDEEEEDEDEFKEMAGFKSTLKKWSSHGKGDSNNNTNNNNNMDGSQMSSADKFKTLKQIKRGNTRSLMERFQIPK